MPTWTRDDGSCALCESTVHCGIHHGPVKPKRTRRTKKPRTIGASEIASILGVGGWTYPGVGTAAGVGTATAVGVDATVLIYGWLCGDVSVDPALTGVPDFDPALTGAISAYPQRCQ